MSHSGYALPMTPERLAEARRLRRLAEARHADEGLPGERCEALCAQERFAGLRCEEMATERHLDEQQRPRALCWTHGRVQVDANRWLFYDNRGRLVDES